VRRCGAVRSSGVGCDSRWRGRKPRRELYKVVGVTVELHGPTGAVEDPKITRSEEECLGCELQDRAFARSSEPIIPKHNHLSSTGCLCFGIIASLVRRPCRPASCSFDCGEYDAEEYAKALGSRRRASESSFVEPRRDTPTAAVHAWSGTEDSARDPSHSSASSRSTSTNGSGRRTSSST
jgi:hypothetical protein